MKAEELELRLKATPFAGSVFDPIRSYLSGALDIQSPSDIRTIRQQGLAMDLLQNVISAQRTQLETRLLAEKREVFDYYDRLKESANLRGSLSPAVLGLGLAVGFRLYRDSQPYWAPILVILTALGIAYALAVRGRQQFERSTEALTTAVLTGLIKSPMIEYWDSQIIRIEDQYRRP